MSGTWLPAPLEVAVDLPHGGRWTSLRSAGREWLWTNPDPDVVTRRGMVRPGDAFVDAGGVEECFPCVRGAPDHGDVWTRPWSGAPADALVGLPGGARLRRTVHADETGVLVDHVVSGEPGTRFVHALHALLDLGQGARLVVPGASTMLVLDDSEAPDGTGERPWPSGLDTFGPDDGSATCVIVPGCGQATVVDGDHALHLAWTCPAEPGLCSLMLWRNLGGWPVDGPYRSVGIEPMIGRTADPVADPAGSCSLDAAGEARWSLLVTASAR